MYELSSFGKDIDVLLTLAVCLTEQVSEIAIPKTWTPMTGNKRCELVTLNAADKEYQDVASEFTKTAGKTIIKVHILVL